MIKNGEFHAIHEMKERGMNISQIANELGRDRKTISRWLAESEPQSFRRQSSSPSKLEPFKAYIKQRMEEGYLNANVIYEEIVAKGYTGGTTVLHLYMQPLRPTIIQKATVRFEITWSSSSNGLGAILCEMGKEKRIYAFVAVLGYSRMMHPEFTEDEKLDTLMSCHIRAFECFGGRPEVMLYDNMETVVTGVNDEGHGMWNERFSRFAGHHGFLLKRCRSYRVKSHIFRTACPELGILKTRQTLIVR